MFILIDGHQFFGLAFGAGQRTFLAQGGWIGSSEVWLPTLELLSSDPAWRTVAFDHRGAGETVAPPDDITYEAMVDDIFRVMDALAIDRCVVGGESSGTQIVLEAVLRHPDRFEGLTLVDGAGGLPRPVGVGPSPITGVPSSWPGGDHAARMRWFVDLCFPEDDVEPIRRWAHHILLRADASAAERLWGIGRNVPSVIDRLAELRLPVLLVHGSRDALVPLASMHALAERLPDSRLVEVDGAGHVPLMTRAAEVAAAIQSRFAAPRHPHPRPLLEAEGEGVPG